MDEGAARSWMDADNGVLAGAVSLAAELADPLRLTALQMLSTEGAHTMSQLAQAMGVSPPRLANHLARLRTAGLVTVEHAGRHAVYRVADPGLITVLEALSRYVGQDGEQPRRPPSPEEVAHTCYDHAAGRLGVSLFATMVEQGALIGPDGANDEVRLGHDLTALGRLGLDVEVLAGGRRLPATACLDRVYRRPHLGGALGAAILSGWLENRLLTKVGQNRVLTLTDTGRRRLPYELPGF